MSIYAFLNCHNCHQNLWLGKALHEDYQPIYYHIGDRSEPPHWQRQQLNQVLWKFLAEHTGHHIDIRLEHEMTRQMHTYQEIGGDGTEDISYEQYLEGWPGLDIGSK